MFVNTFSFDGRIRRTEYGISTIIAVLLSLIPIIGFIPALWIYWAQGAKRCHDVGNSGWWQLIPFYGFWLLFQDGEHGKNQYGDNPKGNQQNTNNYKPKIQQPANSTGGYDSGNYIGGHNNHNNIDYSKNQSNPNNGKNNSSGEYNSGELYK